MPTPNQSFNDKETLLQIIDELDSSVLTPAFEPIVDEVMDDMDADTELQQALRRLKGDAEEDYYDEQFNQRLAVLLMARYTSFIVKDNTLMGMKDGEEFLLSPLVD